MTFKSILGHSPSFLGHALLVLQEQWSWQAHEAELPDEEFNPETPRALLRERVRQRTPRLDSQVCASSYLELIFFRGKSALLLTTSIPPST